MTAVQVVEQAAYTGRHRGGARPVVQVTEHLARVEGLWCQVSVATGDGWWSADGQAWSATPPVTGAHAVVAS